MHLPTPRGTAERPAGRTQRRHLTTAAATLALAAGFVLPPVSAAHAQAPTCNGKPATIIGTAGNDNLTGTAGNDVIVGLSGDDTISGGLGNDTICAGAGKGAEAHAGSPTTT